MSLLPQEIIRRKRDGEALSETEIEFMVAGLTSGALGDGQADSPIDPLVAYLHQRERRQR